MTFVLKPQAPFERLKEANDCPEVALNKAIILQAIIDASAGGSGLMSRKIAKDAHSWLFSNSESFKSHCIAAELEPSYVTKLARDMIKLHSESQEQKRFSSKREENNSQEVKTSRFKTGTRSR